MKPEYHVGDVPMFSSADPNDVVVITSVYTATIKYTKIITGGGNIFGTTTLVDKDTGIPIQYQIRHFTEFYPGITVEMKVAKGQPIAILRLGSNNPYRDPGNNSIIDVMVYRGKAWWDEGAYNNYSKFSEYYNVFTLIEHALIAQNVQYWDIGMCK